MTEDQRTMRDLLRRAVAKLPQAVRLRAENAFAGFERAHTLLPIDREMASFRAITAEEEAAAALFRSLQLRGYPGSELLNLGNHRHKAALGPFLQAGRLALASGRKFNLNVTLDASKPSLEVSLPLSEIGISYDGSEHLQLTMVEPLGLLAKQNEQSHPADYFDNALDKIVASTALSSIDKLIAKEANARNRLLYASDDALPCSQATTQSIQIRQRRADIALYLCVAILQTRTHQSLAKQGLESFLKVIGKPPEEPSNYQELPVDVAINIRPEGQSEVSFLAKRT